MSNFWSELSNLMCDISQGFDETAEPCRLIRAFSGYLRSGSVVECLARDEGVVGSDLT